MLTFNSLPFSNFGAKFAVGLNVKGIDQEKRPLPGGDLLSEYINIIPSGIAPRMDVEEKFSANQASSTSSWRGNILHPLLLMKACGFGD